MYSDRPVVYSNDHRLPVFGFLANMVDPLNIKVGYYEQRYPCVSQHVDLIDRPNVNASCFTDLNREL